MSDFIEKNIGGVVYELRMCKCGRAPWRRRQRNCHFCNRDAQKRYKAQLKNDASKLGEARKIFVPG